MFHVSLQSNPRMLQVGWRVMVQEFLNSVMPILFFFLATLLALCVSFMVERYKK